MRFSRVGLVGAVVALGSVLVGVRAADAARPDGELEIKVVDAESKEPLAARLNVLDARRRPLRTRGIGLAKHGDHFYIDGSSVLGLRRGQYTFDLDCGPEYKSRSGNFEIDRRSEDSETIEMHRVADLAKEGWYAADLDCDRPLIDLGVVLRAEQITYTPLTSWRLEKGKAWRPVKRRQPAGATTPAGVAQHAASVADAEGSLLLFRPDDAVLGEAPGFGGAPSVGDLREAREQGYRVVAADTTSWRLPIWLAGGVLDAINVIDRNCVGGVASKTGRRPPRLMFPGPQGPGRWRETIYFHALNAGLRLPAVAGSGSGDTETHLGASRVYAHCPDEFTVAAWWEAVDAGETVVTNGPLLRPSVFGRYPGYVFGLRGGSFEAPIALNLSTRRTVEYLELIQNGEVAESVALRGWAESGGRLPELTFDASGWFTIRAVTDAEDRYEYALSSPFYVEGSAGPRISRASCQFFVDWLGELADRRGQLTPDADRKDLTAAQQFWQTRLKQANAP